MHAIPANWLNLWAASGPPVLVHTTGVQFPATTAFWKYPENHRWSLEHKVCISTSHQETETISCQTLSKMANRKNSVQPRSWHSSLIHHQMAWTWKWLFFNSRSQNDRKQSPVLGDKRELITLPVEAGTLMVYLFILRIGQGMKGNQ